MTHSDRSALVLGDATGRAERFLPNLRRAGLEVRRTERAAEALPAVLEAGTDLLVVALPLRGAERVLAALRLAGSASLRAGALVVGAGEGHEDTDLALGRMANRLLPPTCSEEEFDRAVATLLGVAPRVEPLPEARLRLLQAQGTEEQLAVANLSTTGLLVRARDPLPLGSVFGFALELGQGEDPVRGQAQVVRIARAGAGGERGFAARFLALGGEGTERLAAAVRRARANSNEAAPPRDASAALPRLADDDAESCRRELAELTPRLDEMLRRGLVRRPGATDWYLTGAELGLESLRAFSSILEPLHEDRTPGSEAARRIEDLGEVRRRLADLGRAGNDLGARVRVLLSLRPALERFLRELGESTPPSSTRPGIVAQTAVEIRRLVGTRRGLERLASALQELRSPRYVVARGAVRKQVERIRADYGGVAAAAGLELDAERLLSRAGARRLAERVEQEARVLRRRIASLHERAYAGRFRALAGGDAEADLLDPRLQQVLAETLAGGTEYLMRAHAAFRHALEAAGADPSLLEHAARLAAAEREGSRGGDAARAERPAPSFGGVGPSWSFGAAPTGEPRH